MYETPKGMPNPVGGRVNPSPPSLKPSPVRNFSQEAAMLAQGITPQGTPLSPDDPLIPMLLASNMGGPHMQHLAPMASPPLVSVPGVPPAAPLVNSHGPHNEIAGGDPLLAALAGLG